MKPYDEFMEIMKGGTPRGKTLHCLATVGTCTFELMGEIDAKWPNSHFNDVKMAKLASAAHRICGLQSVNLPFDLTVEAEVLGLKINYFNGERWPWIRGYIDKVSTLEVPNDLGERGRVPVIIKAIKRLHEEFYGDIPVVAFMNPPFTLLSFYLIGPLNFFRLIRKEPRKVNDLMLRVQRLTWDLANLYVESGADVITLHDMGASCDVAPPAVFKRFNLPYLKNIVKRVRAPVILNICGRVGEILGFMVETGANAVAIDEKTPVKTARLILDRYERGYPLIGNVSPRTICNGPLEKIRAEIKEALKGGATVISPGCDLHLETPTENLCAFIRETSKMLNI